MARPLQRVKNDLLFGLLAVLRFVLNALPLGLARRVGAALGRLFFAIVPFERKKTLAQLALAFPEQSVAWRRHLGAQVFAHLGRGGVEYFRFDRMSHADLNTWIESTPGFERLQALIQAGKGAVVVTAHLGHWELLAAWCGQHIPVAVVGRQLYDPRLDARLTAWRKGKGVEVFPRNTSVRPILRWLKDGKALGVLADQDTDIESLYVDFFGQLVKTPSGPAVLAQAADAALITVFVRRLEDGRYRLTFEELVQVPARGQGAMDLWDCVQEYTRRTEAAIRLAPEQWVWNHTRARNPVDKPSVGWDLRNADLCRQRAEAWIKAGRPPLAMR